MKNSLVLAALIGALLFSGCDWIKGRSRGDTTEEAWVVAFKKDLSVTEQRFFQARYIQKQDDPFYLKEVLPRLSADKPLDSSLKRQIELRRDDFAESWPVLTDQLERTQLIFAITSVLPAFRATIQLARVTPGGLDVETAGMIAQVKQLVEQGTVFNVATKQLELAPEAKAPVVELAERIAVKVLKLIAAAPASAELTRYRNEIRLLHPAAAAKAGQAVSVSEEPFITEPLKAWTELKAVYDGIFSTLTGVERAEKLRNDLTATRSKKEARALRLELEGLRPEVSSKISSLGDLTAREAKLLEQLLFSTEKQFALAKALTQ